MAPAFGPRLRVEFAEVCPDLEVTTVPLVTDRVRTSSGWFGCWAVRVGVAARVVVPAGPGAAFDRGPR
ncbi:hypothetical protein GCM10023222_47620 [Saccharopolyspora cebuensis]